LSAISGVSVEDIPGSDWRTGLRKQSPPLYPKMRSFSGAVRHFSTFEKMPSQAVPEIVCSARQYDLHCALNLDSKWSREGISSERAPERAWNARASEDRRRKLSAISGVSVEDIPGSDWRTGLRKQ
jgi:hypothetical protein